MVTPDFFRREVATSLDAAPSLMAFAQRLLRAFDSRERALRIVRSAACARRNMLVEVHERFMGLNRGDIGEGGDGSELLSLFRAFQLNAGNHAHREAQLRVLLEATLENLVITNDALTDLATSMAKQLVGEPGKLISGNELAEKLGVSEEAVRQRLQAGKLIAILSAGRERGRGFPIFQAWDGIAGAPLEQVLKAIGYEGPGKAVDAADAFQFFISCNDLLGGFTPVEVLTGAGVPDPDDIEAAEFLARPHQERLEFVSSVARALGEARDT